MKSQEELESYLKNTMKLSGYDIESIVLGNSLWAQYFDNFELKYGWRLADSGGHGLQQCMEIPKNKGWMKWDNPIRTARLREEISVIAKNKVKDLSPYFLPIHDIIA